MKGERDILIDTQEPVDKRAREKQKQKIPNKDNTAKSVLCLVSWKAFCLGKASSLYVQGPRSNS